MSTITRGLFALLLVPAALGVTAGGPASAARTHHPVLQATLRGSTLEVTGHNFSPGAQVTIVVIDTESWQVLARGSTAADPAIDKCRKGTSVVCGLPNPNAGVMSFEMTLQRSPDRAALAVLYRSRGEIGLGRVRSR
jgi:hypothetical protein